MTNDNSFAPADSGLVSRSAGLRCMFTYAVLHLSLAHPSCTKKYATLCAFFFRVESGIVVLSKTLLIVSVDVRWLVTWNTHHPQLVPQSPDVFSTHLHSRELRAKRACLDSSLLLGQPIYGAGVEEYDVSRTRIPCGRVSCIIGIDKCPNNKAKTSRLWHIVW